MSPTKRAILDVISGAILWSLWSFRNETIFGTDHPKRILLFGKIVDYSFKWYSSRYEGFPISDDDYAISPSPIPSKPLFASFTSSSSSEFLEVICNICMEDKTFEMFPNNGSCGHLFCSDCISKHIDAKIKENIIVDNALCESLIKGSEKFYFPFKDCSVLLVDDGGEAVTECPHCKTDCFALSVRNHGMRGWIARNIKALIKKGEIARSNNMLMDLAKIKK
ncbi:Zinc finger, C6HC-type [Artemisia annua]|uniref:Zinc finger, C6HC-type n=1 Tax=Artemisia annua TaxID=35608 RepID=A0A2U1P4A6_ARTAN|nr:Zinc finger, C6HC-type [Artemisia annua]